MLGLILTATLIAATDAQSEGYNLICLDHTMVLYPAKPYGANCVPPVYSGVTKAADKTAIIDAHNTLRRIVANGLEIRGKPGPQPPAANMRRVVWDDELATIAQRWANQCTFQHDTCRDVEHVSVSQNLHIDYNRETLNEPQDWASVVKGWYKQVKDFSKNNINPYQYSAATDQYALIVSADTYMIGCGFTAYSTSDHRFNRLYVCNYGARTDDINAALYKTGRACSQCPTADSICYDGLCV